jgi:EpsI family protein
VIGQRHALWLIAAVLGAAIAYAHWPALVGMKAMWDNTPMYSFGYIVPAVSVFLIWSRRERLRQLTPRPAILLGAGVAAIALLLLLAGRIGGVLILEQFAFVVSLVGAVLLVFGTATLRTIWVGLAYLLLMVPFWDALTEPLHQPFQQLSATLGIWMLHAVGVPAHQEGVMLYLPNVTLEVARACSGVNYLVAILALGVPLSYLYLHAMWRRALLIAVAILIAALSNSLRVGLIGILAYFDIGSPLHGPFHVLHGLFVSSIGYVVLLVGSRVLADRRPTEASQPPAAADGARPHSQSAPLRHLLPGLAMAAAFVLFGALFVEPTTAPVSPARPLAALPDRLGEWTADYLASPVTSWWDSADEELHRRYRFGALPPVDVSVGYFGLQKQGKELASHLSAPLHRAAGSRSDDTDARMLPIRLKASSGDRVGYFWYEIDGDVLTNPYLVKGRTFWNAVVRGRTNGTIVVLLGPLAESSERSAQATAVRDLAVQLEKALRPILSGE